MRIASFLAAALCASALALLSACGNASDSNAAGGKQAEKQTPDSNPRSGPAFRKSDEKSW